MMSMQKILENILFVMFLPAERQEYTSQYNSYAEMRSSTESENMLTFINIDT